MWGGESEAAIAEARTAFVLNPNSAFVLSMLGCVLGFGGHREEALNRLQQAMRASPHDPLIWLWTLWTGVIRFNSRKFDVAVESLRQVVRLRPGYNQSKVLIAASLAHLGRINVEQIRRHGPWPRDQQALLSDDGRRHHG
jgi:adenylate cyclase